MKWEGRAEEQLPQDDLRNEGGYEGGREGGREGYL
jgi:hypothetical protein